MLKWASGSLNGHPFPPLRTFSNGYIVWNKQWVRAGSLATPNHATFLVIIVARSLLRIVLKWASGSLNGHPFPLLCTTFSEGYIVWYTQWVRASSLATTNRARGHFPRNLRSSFWDHSICCQSEGLFGLGNDCTCLSNLFSQHMSFWCLFLDPCPTSHHYNIGVPFKTRHQIRHIYLNKGARGFVVLALLASQINQTIGWYWGLPWPVRVHGSWVVTITFFWLSH